MNGGQKAGLFYVIVIAFACGIFARSFVPFGLTDILWLGMVSFVVAMAGRTGGASRFIIPSLAIFCFALGALRFEWASWSDTDPDLEARVGQTVTFEGVIGREPEDRGSSIHLYVETDDGTVLVSTAPGGDWRYGDPVIAEGQLKKPEAFETDLGRSFNYPGYLLARGVSYTVGFAKVERAGGRPFSPIGSLLEGKRAFMSRIERLIPEPEAGLAEGVLLGVKRSLGEELEQTFRRTGIIHIVVLSGYNVMIVVTFVLYVLGTVFGRRGSVLVGVMGIVAFALLVGLSATVVRASLMASLLLIMGLTGRVYLVLRGLLLSGAAMLLWNPYLLAFDAGFQLSFLATLGLILVAPHIESRLERVPTLFQAREFLVATLATQLFVLPVLLYQVGQFSVVAVIVNVLVLPMVPIAMLLTFFAGLAAFVSMTLAAPLAYLSYLSLAYIIAVAEWFGSLPFAAFSVPAFPFWLVPVGYAAIAFCLWRVQRKLSERGQ